MKNLNKFILIAAFLVIIIFPAKTQAVTIPRILPDCDVTVYIVQKNGNPVLNKDKCKDTQCIYARDYVDDTSGTAQDKYGSILSVLDYNACGFDEFKGLLINAYRYGLTLLAAVVLFFFIWGGFGLIIAGGRPEHIQNAKNVLKGAFIGMLVVLTAWVMINFYVFTFSGDPQSKIFGQFWWGGSEECHETFNLSCDKNNLHYGCGGPKGSPTDLYIQQVQREIGKLGGCDCGPVDGCFGTDTYSCVTSFQISSNINDPLGTVGANTWTAIASGTGSCQFSTPDIDFPTSETTHCCIPDNNVPDNPFTVCVDSNEDCTDPLFLPLEYYNAYPGACNEGTNAIDCGTGCCIPIDLTQSCYDTYAEGCATTPNIVYESCIIVPECTYKICVRGINDCYYQRENCEDANHETNYTASTIEEATAKILDIPECNYGTCAVPIESSELIPGFDANLYETYYQCIWITRSECESRDGEFLWNIPNEFINETIPNTDIYCYSN